MSDHYKHVMDCLETARNGRFCAGAEKAATEIERLRAENEKLREGILEALEWNWLSDDFPENLYFELAQLAQPKKPPAEIWADIKPEALKAQAGRRGRS